MILVSLIEACLSVLVSGAGKWVFLQWRHLDCLCLGAYLWSSLVSIECEVTGAHQDSMWVVVRHSPMIENCYLVAVGEA